MKASVIVVIYSGVARLDDAPASISPTEDVELIIVDNGSIDRCGEEASRRFPRARVIRSEHNLGFAGGANLGAETAEGEVLIFLNDDAVAAKGFVDAHLDVLDAHPGAAASAGRMISWDGARHDFVRGRMTFDAHAFQVGQGYPLVEVEAPGSGEVMPFACGGNMAVRRSDWQEHGGFDADLFAYFEDVELSWRLTACGRDIVAAPGAVARHRGSATSNALGDFRRGVLFERNALRTFFACADEELREAMGNAVLLTFIHRLARFAEQDPELAAHAADPFAPAQAPLSRRQRWSRRFRERGLGGALRHLAARALLGPSAGVPQLSEGHLLMQLRAARGFFDGIECSRERRQSLERLRTVPDRDIMTRFPRLIVPTYPGDEAWFSSASFEDLLPQGWALERGALSEILHPSLLGA